MPDPMGIGKHVRTHDLIRGLRGEERPEHPGIALDRPSRARAGALLDEERVDRLVPVSVAAGGGGQELRVHRRYLERLVHVDITHSGGRRKQHDAGIVTVQLSRKG